MSYLCQQGSHFLPCDPSENQRASNRSATVGVALRESQVYTGSRSIQSAHCNLWTFRLPGLAERLEDIEPNLEYELLRWEEKHGRRLTMNREARERFLGFARSGEAKWLGNFRDFNAAITRMAVLCEGLRIDERVVESEIQRLKEMWERPHESTDNALQQLQALLGDEPWEKLDRFERV